MKVHVCSRTFPSSHPTGSTVGHSRTNVNTLINRDVRLMLSWCSCIYITASPLTVKVYMVLIHVYIINILFDATIKGLSCVDWRCVPTAYDLLTLNIKFTALLSNLCSTYWTVEMACCQTWVVLERAQWINWCCDIVLLLLNTILNQSKKSISLQFSMEAWEKKMLSSWIQGNTAWLTD